MKIQYENEIINLQNIIDINIKEINDLKEDNIKLSE